MYPFTNPFPFKVIHIGRSQLFTTTDGLILDFYFSTFLTVRKKDAGLASVDVTVVNPLGKELPLEVKSLPNDDGDLVEFYPTLPGKYRFNVLFGGEAIPGIITFIHLFKFIYNSLENEFGPSNNEYICCFFPSGSPFTFIVEEEGLAKAYGEGLLHGMEGSLTQFYIDARGLVGEPTVQVISI